MANLGKYIRALFSSVLCLCTEQSIAGSSENNARSTVCNLEELFI